jgi:hypothetical protein
MAKAPRLRMIAGGKAKKNGFQTEIDSLFSGKIPDTSKKKTRSRKKEQPPLALPRDLQKLSDVFAAGRAIQKEVELRADFARQRIEEYCIEEIANEYAAVNRRPSSRNFSAKHSRFKFVLTERTTMTSEKSEELREMGIPIEQYTEVRGIQINYDAIRQHHLEAKLREALGSMRIPAGVLEEIFTPAVQLKESFYDVLSEVVKSSLKPGEKLEEKLKRTLEILNPATQIRNVEVLGLTPKQCFDLVNSTEIEAEDEIA